MSGVIQTLIGSLTAEPRGEQAYTTGGSFAIFTVPAGVTSVCVVCIGGGAGTAANVDGFGSAYCGGGAGGLTYKNNISVTPGQTCSVTVGSGGAAGGNGGDTIFSVGGVYMVAGGGTVSGKSAATSGGDVNNHGSCSSYTVNAGGGAAYMGSGGNASYTYDETNNTPYAATGGVNSGAITIAGGSYTAFVSNPSLSSASLDGTNGTTRYAGDGGFIFNGGGIPATNNGASGGVRIIWGSGRSYPSNAL